MPKIIITEKDLTNPVSNTLPMDVVYIPGFSTNDSCPVNTPTYLTTLSEFHNLFGDTPRNFYGAQRQVIHQWSDLTYSKYDLVIWNGKYYTSKVDNNENHEPVDPDTATALNPYNDDYWSTDTILPWDNDATDYNEFAMVLQDGFVYVRNDTTPYDTTAPGTDGNACWVGSNIGSGAGETLGGHTYDFDIAFVLAETLLSLGLPIYYDVLGAQGVMATSIETFMGLLSDELATLSDKGSYSIKYITTGGYPIVGSQLSDYDGIINAIVATAANRGDAIAIIDCDDNDPLTGTNSAFELVNRDSKYNFNVGSGDNVVDGGGYATLFTTWDDYENLPFEYKRANTYVVDSVRLPASFAYLTCLAKSLKNNPGWLSIAGVTRGLVPYVNHTTTKLTNKIADSYQTYGKEHPEDTHGRSINGITNIRPYGLTIWGNRTLLNNTDNKDIGAFAYLNIRSLVCDVKKTVYAAAQRYMFEQNNEKLWLNFKSVITPLLDRMATGGGISGYKILKQKCANSAKLLATIVLYPIYAVEEIEVEIQMTNEEVTVAE